MHSVIAVPVNDIVHFFFCFPMLEPSLFGGKSGDDIFKVCTLHRLHLESTKVLPEKNYNVNGTSHLKKCYLVTSTLSHFHAFYNLTMAVILFHYYSLKVRAVSQSSI